MMIPIAFSKKHKGYFTNERPLCEHCKDRLTDKFILQYEFRAKVAEMKQYCPQCHDRAQVLGQVVERKLVFIRQKMPKDAIAVPPIKPQLTNSTNMSVFEAVDKQIGNETVVDRTRLAGRESWEGATIGAPDYDMLEEKDKSVDDMFNVIITAKPIEKKTKEIEDKE